MHAATLLLPLLVAGVAAGAAPPPPAPAPAADEAVFSAAMLAPHFKSGPGAEASAAIRDARWAAALKAVPADATDPRLRFLRALALAGSAQHAEAAKLFVELEPLLTPLRPRLACLAVASFEASGAFEAALAQADECGGDPVKGKFAKVTRARLLNKAGRGPAAIAELKAVASSATGALRNEAYLALAHLLADGGDVAGALEAVRKVSLDDPAGPAADRAAALAHELSKQEGAVAASPARLADRVDKLLQANSFKTALAAANEMGGPRIEAGGFTPHRCVALPPKEPKADAKPEAEPAKREGAAQASAIAPFSLANAREAEGAGGGDALPSCAIVTVSKPADPLACRLQMLEGVAVRKNRNPSKALPMLREVYERCTEVDVRARALYTAATAAISIGDPDGPILASAMARQFKDHALADDALMSLAGWCREHGDPLGERAALRRLVDGFPESDQRAEALFQLFWSHRSSGHPERGLGYLTTLSKEYDAGPKSDGGDSERGRYWWGRTVASHAEPADRAKGTQALTALARERPITYYGLLARSILVAGDGKPDPVPPAGFPAKTPLHLGPLAKDPGFTIGVELLRLGLRGDARDAFAAVDFKALRDDPVRGREAALIVIEQLKEFGDSRLSHGLARREILRSARDFADPLAYRASLVAYPLVYRESILQHCTSAGFAPNFLQGLMREESALDPRAKSPVGARGLTQLMPATAKAVAKSLGIKRFSVDHLWEPDLNIRIGSTYLARMLKTFGHPGLAAAAYNAGPGAVAKWLKKNTRHFDEFVEEIPYAETKGYVKRVLRSYAAYHFLYDREPADRNVRVSLTLAPAPEGTTQATGLSNE